MKDIDKNQTQLLIELVQLRQRVADLEKVEQTLRVTEERWQLSLQGSNDGLWDWNIETDECFFSARWKAMLGFADAELPNTLAAWKDRVHPDDLPIALQALEAHFNKSAAFYSCEHRLRCKDGSYKWTLGRGQALWDDEGNPIRLAGTSTDLTEQKGAENALRVSEERYRLISQSISDYAISLRINSDGSSTIEWLTDSFTRITGYTVAEVMQRGMSSYIHPDDLDRIKDVVKNFVPHVPTTYQFRIVRKDGEVRWLQATGRATVDDSGRVVRIYSAARDITQQKHIEEQARVNEERWQLAVSGSNDAIWDWQVSTSEVYFSPRWREMLGYEQHEIANDFAEWENRLHPDDKERSLKDIERYFAGETPLYISEHRLRCKDGSYKWIYTRGKALHDEAGNVIRMTGALTDLTERKQAEEALRLSEERWQLAARGTNDGLWDWNVATGEVYFSPRWKEMIGYEDHELPNRYEEWNRRVHPEDQELTLQVLNDHLSGKTLSYVHEYRLRCKDGTYKWIFSRAKALRDDAGNVVRMVGTHSDRTERKRAEEALRESEERYRLLAVYATDFISRHNPVDSVNLYVSPSSKQLLGYEPEEMIGRSFLDWVHPDDRVEMAAAVTKIARTLETGLVTFRVRRKDGEYIWLESTTRGVRDPQTGKLTEIIGSARDVTARKRAEEELTKAKDAAEAANQAKSQFLANMSHEIRTPMNGVLGMSELLLGTEMSAKQQRFAETIHNSAETLLSIINDILDFSKIEAGKLELEKLDFDLRQTVEEVADLLASRAHKKGLELACRIHADVPTAVRGDQHRVRQILTNLIGNAIKFTERGEVVVEVRNGEWGMRNAELEGVVDSPQLRTPPASSVGGNAESRTFLRFSIRDTGIGLKPEEQERLFQPFAQADGSTTRKYGGTGLGLAISRQLAVAMDGEIGVESLYGQGSTFWFAAPFDLQPQPAAARFSPGQELQSLRILIVDDNATNRDILHHQLDAWGIRNNSAPSGTHALQLLYKAMVWKDPFDLAILDMHMPEMDGIQLAKHIKADEALASTRLVMLTSAGQYGDAEAARNAGIEVYLGKPVRQSDLYNALATIVGARNAAPPVLRRQQTGLPPVSTPPVEGQIVARVLLAEDNLINQEVAVNMLELLGCQVTVANHGREVLEALSRAFYDLIFMDCHMPEMDGFAATTAIREQEKQSSMLSNQSSVLQDVSQNSSLTTDNRQLITSHIPIIALTANALDGDEERCLAAGMDGYLSKPFSQEKLQAVLKKWLPKGEQRKNSSSSTPVVNANTVPPSLPSAPVLDEQALAEIRLLQKPGKPSVLHKLVSTYLADTPQRVAALHAAIEKEDSHALQEAAHSVKGSSATLGLRQFAEVCKTLEQYGRAQTTAPAKTLASALDAAYAAASAALQAILQNSGGAQTPPPVQASQPVSSPPAPQRTIVEQPQRSAQPVILLVEDNLVNQEVAAGMLEGLGYRVDTADNGRAGLEAIIRKRYALVLMDCQMPEMDGYAATQAVRAREAAFGDTIPRLPIIALTANTMVGDREKCLAAGMDDYLGKPYSREQLHEVLQRWLSTDQRLNAAA